VLLRGGFMKKTISLGVILTILILCSASLTVAFSFRDLFTRETGNDDFEQEENTGRGYGSDSSSGRSGYVEEDDEPESDGEGDSGYVEDEDLIVSLYSYSCNAGGNVNYAFEMNQVVNDGDDYKICIDGDCEYVCSKASSDYKLMCLSLEPLGSSAEVQLFYNNQEIFSETKQIPGCDVEVDLSSYSCNVGGKINYAFELDQLVSSGEGYEICIGEFCEDSCFKTSDDYKIFCTSSKNLGNSAEVKLINNNQEIFSETKQIPECEFQMDKIISSIYLNDIESIAFKLIGKDSGGRYKITMFMTSLNSDYESESAIYLNGILIGNYNAREVDVNIDNFEEAKYLYDSIRQALTDFNNEGGLPITSSGRIDTSTGDCDIINEETYCHLDFNENSYDYIHLIEEIK